MSQNSLLYLIKTFFIEMTALQSLITLHYELASHEAGTFSCIFIYVLVIIVAKLLSGDNGRSRHSTKKMKRILHDDFTFLRTRS